MSGVTVLRMAKMASLASSYAVMRGETTMALGARLMATAMGMAECTPNGLTSYEAASTTPRRGSPPTITGLPRSSGESRCSTDAKNASMSRWMMAVAGTQGNGSSCRKVFQSTSCVIVMNHRSGLIRNLAQTERLCHCLR